MVLFEFLELDLFGAGSDLLDFAPPDAFFVGSTGGATCSTTGGTGCSSTCTIIGAGASTGITFTTGGGISSSFGTVDRVVRSNAGVIPPARVSKSRSS